MAKLLAFGACAAMLASGLTLAHADSNWSSSQKAWEAQDSCARQAYKRFPDYTQESNAKRERARQLCVTNGKTALGSVAPLAPAAPLTGRQDP